MALNWYLRAAGILTSLAGALLGSVVMVGWWVESPLIVQIAPGLGAMQFNTALGFLLAGLGLLATHLERHHVAVGFGAAVLLLAGAVSVEHWSGAGLGIDTLVHTPFLVDLYSPPGRMSAGTALNFLFTGGALTLLALPRQAAASVTAGGTLAAVVVTIGLFRLLGLLAVITGAQDQVQSAGMALHTAVGFTLVGSAGLLRFVRSWHTGALGLSTWLGLPAVIGGLALTSIVSLALFNNSLVQSRERVELRLNEVVGRLGDRMETRLRALSRITGRWATRGGTPRAEWEADARAYLGHAPEIRAIARADNAGIERWVVVQAPDAGLEASFPTDRLLERDAMATARQAGAAITTARTGTQGENVIQLLFPFTRTDGSPDGFLVAIVDMVTLLDSILPADNLGVYGVSVSRRDTLLYRNRPDPGPLRSALRATGHARIRDDVEWTVRVWPTPESLQDAQWTLPMVVLAFGAALSLLTGLAVHMAQRAERGRLTAEGVSTELGAETERRRQAEESFKGLVEAAPNALVLVDHAGTITLVNSQTERWFGYARDDLLGRKVELLVPAELHDRHRAHLAGYTKNPTRRPMGSGIRLEAVRKDGSRFAVDISLSPVRTVEGPRIIAAINDISHHREAQDELERTNRTLSAVNHELEAFAYSVSHDLRQPLRAVDGFCNALQEDYQAQLDDTGKRYLEQVRAGAQRMGRLIDDLLQLSRITRAELKREPVDMTAVAQAILEELRQGEPERDVSVKIADGLQAVADPRMLEVLLSNLLGNAWKFTAHSETPEIELGVQNGQTVPVYFVRDNGVGFDMKYVKNLFGAFQRLHSDAEFPGTGIGLATVQRIVHRLGGQVWVTAVRGEGATFFFTLST